MPKGSFGGGRSSSRSSSRSFFSSKPQSSYSYSSPKSPVPTPAPTTIPTQYHNVKVEQPGFFSNIMQGFGLGAGQSMAFNLFRSTPSTSIASIGTSSVTATTQDIPFPKEYIQCMKEYNNSDACKQYLEKDDFKQLH